MTTFRFKVGDTVITTMKSDPKVSLVGTILSISGGFVFADWTYSDGRPNHRGNADGRRPEMKLLHPEIKYDPMQQGDTEEDI